MEESFPRGGKRSESAKSDKNEPASKRRKLTEKKTGIDNDSAKKTRSTKREASPDPLAALWTGKMSTEICISDLLVLGCVRTVLDHSVQLDLPDGLKGILTFENVSSTLTEKLLRQHQASGVTPDIKLTNYFTRGQLISCKIIPDKDDTKPQKTKRRRRTQFQVTTDPEEVNAALSTTDIVVGMVLNAAVKSVEEKGYLMNLGLTTSGSESLGFLPFDNCGTMGAPAKDNGRYSVGQVINCAVADAPSIEAASDRRVIKLSTSAVHLNGSADFTNQRLSKEQYTPGLVVKAMVEKVIPSKGLIIRLAKPGGGCWRGFVSKWKLQNRTSQPTNYKPQQSLKVAVLFTMANSTVFGLSAESHLTARAADVEGRTDLLGFGTVGDLVYGSVKLATSKGVVYFELSTGKHRTPVLGKAARFQLQFNSDDGELIETEYSIGSRHKLRIVGYSLMERLFHVDAREKVFNHPVIDVESCLPGTLVQASIVKVIAQGICVRLYGHIRGFVPIFHCYDSTDAAGVKRLAQRFTAGQQVKARILHADMEKDRVVLTLKKKLITSPLPTLVNSFDPNNVGQQADGFVAHINENHGILVVFYNKIRGYLPKVELDKHDVATDKKLTEAFHIGQVIRVLIKEVDVVHEKILLAPVVNKTVDRVNAEKENTVTTARPVLKRENSLKKCCLAVGKIYTAVVTKVRKLQLSVLIEHQHEGRVFVTELGDDLGHGSSPLTKYSIGQPVNVKVIAIRTKRRRKKSIKDTIKKEIAPVLGSDETSTKRTFQFVECTMKVSKLKAKSAKKRVIGFKEHFRKGERVAAVVDEITRKDGVEYNCHVTVNPIWKGVVPMLQLSTDINVLRNPWEHFSPGHVIVGRVAGIQDMEKHLQLTCLKPKACHVTAGEKTKVLVVAPDSNSKLDTRCRLVDGTYGFIPRQDPDDAAIEPGEILEARAIEKLSNGKWKLSIESNTTGSTSKNFSFEATVSKKPKTIKEEPVEQESEPEPEATSNSSVSAAMQRMQRASTFSWGSGRFSMANLMGLCLGDRSETGKPEEKKISKSGAGSESKSKFERERMEEEELFQKEMALLNPEGNLDNADNFDRLVMGSPDSSLIWMRYMAFYLQAGDVPKARTVAERALKTISVREQTERFNIWAALLNLEDAYGTTETFRHTFDEAVVVNDPMKIYELATKILWKSNKIEQCDSFFNEMLFKFKAEFSVWTWLGDYYMATGRADKARDTMKRAMRSLPSSKHVDLVSRFAQLEYRYSSNTASGDPERGRTLFENVLRDYPRRTDVWSVYIDMTAKYQGIQEARPLLERVTSLKLNVHNMRLFYKKWLDLEERRGTPETLGQVKKRAAEYVEGALAVLPESKAISDDDGAE